MSKSTRNCSPPSRPFKTIFRKIVTAPLALTRRGNIIGVDAKRINKSSH